MSCTVSDLVLFAASCLICFLDLLNLMSPFLKSILILLSKNSLFAEIMKLQSKFEEDKKRIQQLRAARKFRPYWIVLLDHFRLTSLLIFWGLTKLKQLLAFPQSSWMTRFVAVSASSFLAKSGENIATQWLLGWSMHISSSIANQILSSSKLTKVNCVL